VGRGVCNFSLATAAVVAQPAEVFTLADLTQYWNRDWKLAHAGFGGAGGGLRGLRGNTYLEGDALATYPRDEVRGTYLPRVVTPSAAGKLSVEVAADKGRVWLLEIFADNDRLVSKLIEGGTDGRAWELVEVPLQA